MSKLNPALKDFWRVKARNRILYGGRASCFDPNTRVIMSDYTIKPIKDIMVGEYVMGDDGKPRLVLDWFSGKDEMFKVKQHFGNDYIVTGNHKLCLKKRDFCKMERGEWCEKTQSWRRPNGRYGTTPDIIDIEVNDVLTKSTKWRDNFRGYKSGLIEFSNTTNLPIDPYFLGLWLGDGNSNNPAITIHKDDIQTIEYIYKYAESLELEITFNEKKDNNAGTYSFVEKSRKPGLNVLKKYFRELELIPSHERIKEFKKHIPLSYLTASKEDRLQLLAGLIDSDGTLDNNKNTITFSQKDNVLFKDFVRLANGLGFRCTENAIIGKFEGFEGIYNIASLCGGLHTIPTKLPRKQATSVGRTKDVLVNALHDIKSIGIGDYVGIEIDGNHRFLLEDHTVVHNSKSWDAAGWAIFLSTKVRLRILCCRQFQSKITESVYTLLKSTIHRWGLQDDFRILNNSIINVHTGSEFLFYGLWRHIDEVKSLEGIDICWIEEAHNLTQEQWEILNPTIRKEGSEFWIIFNPRLITDFVYKRFVTNTPEDTVKRKINYIDNPFLSQTMLKVIDGARQEDEDDYTHIYLGEPKMDDEESVIQRSHVMAAIDAHIKLNVNVRGRKTIGYDVADAGEDFNATVSAHGSLAYHLDCWKGKEDELLKSCSRVWARAREDGAVVKYDAIGVGASAGAQFNVLNQQNNARVQHQKFFAGGTPNKPDHFYGMTNIKNRDFFSNIKAQAWWGLADRFRNTYNAVKNGQQFKDDEMIFIDSNLDKLDQLIDELCTPKRDFDLAGRVKVESKKDLAKRDIASPNCADAFVAAFADTSSGGLF